MYRFLDVDAAASTPIWRQIEDGGRRQVASGRLAVGSALPSVRSLARALRVNPATVSKAYRRLTDAGLLTVRRGEGTFVAELLDDDRGEERQRLLEDGATAFARLAQGVGADRDEAARAVEEAWEKPGVEGGQGKENHD